MINEKKKEILPRGTAFFPIQYYLSNTNSPLYNLPVHWHNEFEILRVIDGQYNCFAAGQEFILKKGDFCIIQDGILHGDAHKKSSCRFESAVFDINMLRNKTFAQDSFLNDICNHKVILNCQIPLSDKKIPAVIDEFFSELKSENEGYELTVCASLMYIFAYIQKNGLYQVNNNIIDKSKIRSEQFRSVINLIQQKYSQSLSLDDLADAAGMSSKYFCRVFREMTHKTPVEYLNAYRIEQACVMLRTTEDTLIDIAYNCGFNDFSYFIKTFKKFKTMTPHKYRNYDNSASKEYLSKFQNEENPVEVNL